MHTHSTYSADGESRLADMVHTAEAMGLEYYGVTEHFDYDYNYLGLLIDGKQAYTDEAGYFQEARALQRQVGGMRFLVGCELGYSDDASVQTGYGRLIATYAPDFVVNSVHTCDGHDCWFQEYFEGKDKREAYERYLVRVLESLSAPYAYDIVAHIGYVSRNAPYSDPKLNYADFSPLYDDILKGIVERGKILEVNSSARGAGSLFLPDVDVLKRYFALGGRAVSFGSDAHSTARICDGRGVIVAALKEIGFTYITIPCRGERKQVAI